MKYYLGIDGGGTKTQFLLADKNLNIIAQYNTTTCHYLQCGFDGVTKVLSEGIREVCNIADVNPNCIKTAFVGCAGYGDTESDKVLIEDSVRAGMHGIFFKIGNDCENALAGALSGSDGINIIAGTGSMACGVNSKLDDENFIRCGGWHHAIGSDEGSAYWIALNLLKEFTRQSDGRDERTDLYYIMKYALRIKNDGDIISVVVDNWKLDRTKIASLSPLCSELCDMNDPYAIKIFESAAYELADMAKAIYNKLEFSKTHPNEIIPVSGTGGVFKAGEHITSKLSEILDQQGMRFVLPEHDPGYGSILLAMKAIR